jgi:hypothetical protein
MYYSSPRKLQYTDYNATLMGHTNLANYQFASNVVAASFSIKNAVRLKLRPNMWVVGLARVVLGLCGPRVSPICRGRGRGLSVGRVVRLIDLVLCIHTCV